MVSTFIALGSNIEPEKNMEKVAAILRKEFLGIRFSNVYKTKAQEVEEQDDFLNAVAVFQSDTPPEKLHAKLQIIEKKLKKNPPFPSGPRTMDLDLLLYGKEILHEDLMIPHLKMHKRKFVLEPLCELIDPTELHPALDLPWKYFLAEVSSQKTEKTRLKL